MKTYMILSSDNQVLLFTEDESVYTLSLEFENERQLIFSAKDTGDGLEFIDGIDVLTGYCIDYGTIDYLRLFLNLINRMDDSFFESYRMLEPVGIV